MDVVQGKIPPVFRNFVCLQLFKGYAGQRDREHPAVTGWIVKG